MEWSLKNSNSTPLYFSNGAEFEFFKTPLRCIFLMEWCSNFSNSTPLYFSNEWSFWLTNKICLWLKRYVNVIIFFYLFFKKKHFIFVLSIFFWLLKWVKNRIKLQKSVQKPIIVKYGIISKKQMIKQNAFIVGKYK